MGKNYTVSITVKCKPAAKTMFSNWSPTAKSLCYMLLLSFVSQRTAVFGITHKFNDNFCEKAPDPGPCAARIPKWHYDGFLGYCQKFYYSGCGGNQNNFASKSLCLDKCLPRQERREPRRKIFALWQSYQSKGYCSDPLKEYLTCGPPCVDGCYGTYCKQCVPGCYCKKPYICQVASDWETTSCVSVKECFGRKRFRLVFKGTNFLQGNNGFSHANIQESFQGYTESASVFIGENGGTLGDVTGKFRIRNLRPGIKLGGRVRGLPDIGIYQLSVSDFGDISSGCGSAIANLVGLIGIFRINGFENQYEKELVIENRQTEFDRLIGRSVILQKKTSMFGKPGKILACGVVGYAKPVETL